jgi:hypothetical protein
MHARPIDLVSPSPWQLAHPATSVPAPWRLHWWRPGPDPLTVGLSADAPCAASLRAAGWMAVALPSGRNQRLTPPTNGAVAAFMRLHLAIARMAHGDFAIVQRVRGDE